jgi:tetraacyldisaccharide-1-P 4'-kinase
VVEFVRPDHDPFSTGTIRDLLDAARHARVGAIVVTGKDWAKLRRVRPEAWPCPVARPQLELGFDSGWETLREHVLGAAGSKVSDGEE